MGLIAVVNSALLTSKINADLGFFSLQYFMSGDVTVYVLDGELSKIQRMMSEEAKKYFILKTVKKTILQTPFFCCETSGGVVSGQGELEISEAIQLSPTKLEESR